MPHLYFNPKRKDKLEIYYKVQIICLLTFIFITNSYAQTTIKTKGTDFWFGYMCNDPVVNSHSINLYMQISSETATTGTVSIPGIGYASNFSVGANQSIIIKFDSTLMNCQEEAPNNSGIHITSQALISVYAINNVEYSTDGALVLPTQALGTEYIVSAYSVPKSSYSSNLNDFGYSEFLIVAVQDSTSIEITPSAATLNNKPAGNAFVISLNAGETYLVQSLADITGTVVKSAGTLPGCKPFAIFAGNVASDVPQEGCYYGNHLVEQTLPVNLWGTNFLVAPFYDQSVFYYSNESYTIRILASANNTSVTISGNSISLNKGQYIDFNNQTAALCISSNNLVAVMKVLQSRTCSGSLTEYSDPALILINPNSQLLYKSVFTPTSADQTFISDNTFYNDIQVIIKTKFINQLKLDGRLVNDSLSKLLSNPYYYGYNSSFVAFGCNEYSYVNLSITGTPHTMEADSGFIAYSYGYGITDAYGYSLGGSLFGNSSSFIALQLSDTSVCPNVPVAITESSGATATAYKYSFGDGDSSFVQNPIHQYSKPGSYTITLQAQFQNGCKDNSTIKITVLSSLNSNFNANDTCLGAPTKFQNLSINNGSGINSYKWYLDQNVISEDVDPTYVYPDTGNHQVTLLVISGSADVCNDSINKTVNIKSNPMVDFTVNSNCYGDSTFFINHSVAANANTGSYVWSLGDGSILNDTNSFYYVYNNIGNYKTTLTVTENGCFSSISKSITIEDCMNIPNIITPNEDTLNDNFVIRKLPPNSAVTIYNRWGGLVFQSANYKNDWNGAGCTDGVYYYFIEDTFGNTKKGWVEIVR